MALPKKLKTILNVLHAVLMKPIIKNSLLIVASLLLVYSVLGFFLLPSVISSQFPPFAKEQLNRELQIDNIQFNPFTLELEITDFKVKKINVNSFFNFRRLYIDIAFFKSIADLTLTINSIQLEKPNLFVIRDKHGDLNFSDVLAHTEPKDQEASSSEIFSVNIIKTTISDGKLSWRDDFYSHAQKEDIYPINLNIDHFTTAPQQQSHLQISLTSTSGGQLKWQGDIELFPFSSSGHIKLDKVGFHRIWELFLQDDVNFELLNGTETFETEYQLSQNDKGTQLLLNNAHLHIYDFKLTEKDSADPLIDILNFKVSGISMNLQNKTIAISKVSAKDAQFKTWLTTEGDINYQSLFSPDTKTLPVTTTPSSSETKNNDWKISVNEVALNNFALEFTDNSLQTPAHFKLSSLNFSTSKITSSLNTELPFDLALTINESGQLSMQGHATLKPFSSEVKIDVSHFSINDLQPYIDPFLQLDIVSGLFNMNAELSIESNPDQALAIRLQGDSVISDFSSINKVSNQELVKWKKLQIQAMDFDLSANSYNINKITLEQPYSRILIRKDKSININDIMINSAEKTQSQTKQKAADKKSESHYKIAQFEMLDGQLSFSDLSLIFPFSTHINQLKGSVKGLSSTKNVVTHIKLTGKAHDISPVNIKGTINQSQGDSAFEIDFLSMPLPLMTPYMAEFAGYKVEKGNMTLGLNYTVKNNQLSASNSLLIDQLVLGEEIENPNAVSLPLNLAIALLEDSDGKIKLDVPITGSLDDPEFSIASIVADALFNVITKVVTSPFYALASLIDSDEDVSQISFAPGNAILTKQQQSKLDSLATALNKRMALKLEIKGTAFSTQDWPLLQAEALNNQLLANSTEESLEKTSLNDEQYQDLLADLFIQQFPQLAERSLLGTAQLINPEMGDFYTIAKTKLAAIIPPDIPRLKQLAAARARAISRYMVEQNISIARMYLLNVSIDPEDTNGDVLTPLSLTVK